jgi:hypothetical protein
MSKKLTKRKSQRAKSRGKKSTKSKTREEPKAIAGQFGRACIRRGTGAQYCKEFRVLRLANGEQNSAVKYTREQDGRETALTESQFLAELRPSLTKSRIAERGAHRLA